MIYNNKLLRFGITFIFLIISSMDIYAINDGEAMIGPPEIEATNIRQSNVNLYTGQFRKSFDLLTVPGPNNFNYDIVLNYASGIKVDQEATWVGLGFDLQPPSIKQVRINEGEVGTPSPEHSDIYYLTIKGKTEEFYRDTYGKYEDYTYILKDWKPWKINEIWAGEEFKGFKVTIENGTTYIFNYKLVNELDNSLHSYSYARPLSGPEYKNSYGLTSDEYGRFRGSITYYCTAIITPDYVDNEPSGIGDEDSGNWIKFEYTKLQEDYYQEPRRRCSYSKSNLLDPGYEVWSWYYLASTSEIAYLNKIITPTHSASFYIDNRSDSYKDSNNNGILQRLSGIKLKDKNNDVLKEIYFNYSYSLCSGYLSFPGKLTLNYVQTKGYNNGLSETEPPLIFGYSYDPDYDKWSADPWGYYNEEVSTQHVTYLADYSDASDWDKYFSEIEGEVAQNHDTNQPLVVYENYSHPDYPVWPPTFEVDYYDDVNQCAPAKAWSLTRIIYPTGGTEDIYYESNDYYQYDYGDVSEKGGGIRVNKIILDSGSGNVTEIDYEYERENSPLNLTSGWAIGCPESAVQMWDLFFRGINTNRTIEYGRVVKVQGNKKTEYTFSSPDANSEETPSEVEYSTNFPYYDRIGSVELTYAYKNNLPLTSNSHDRGKLVGKRYYENDILLKQISCVYYSNELASVGNITKFRSAINEWHENYYRYLLKSKKTPLFTEDIIYYDPENQSMSSNSSKTFFYNSDNGLLSKVTEESSQGQTKITEYRYAFQEYQGMDDKNMLSQIYSVTTKEGESDVESKSWTVWDLFSDNWYPSEEWAWTGDLTLSNDETAPEDPISEAKLITDYDEYDNYGNLLQQSDANSTPYVTKWAYNHAYPVGNISNASNDKMMDSMTSLTLFIAPHRLHFNAQKIAPHRFQSPQKCPFFSQKPEAVEWMQSNLGGKPY